MNQTKKAPFANILEHEDTNISDTVDTAGSNTIIASPGLNRHIVVTSFVIQNEAAQATTTMILQDGGHDAWRFLAAAQGDALAMVFPANHPWKLRENQPLALWLSGANVSGYSIQYYIEQA